MSRLWHRNTMECPLKISPIPDAWWTLRSGWDKKYTRDNSCIWKIFFVRISFVQFVNYNLFNCCIRLFGAKSLLSSKLHDSFYRTRPDIEMYDNCVWTYRFLNLVGLSTTFYTFVILFLWNFKRPVHDSCNLPANANNSVPYSMYCNICVMIDH